MRSAALGQGRGAHQRAIRAVEAQAHLGGHGNMGGYGAAHVLDDLVEQLRLLEQHRATSGFIHGLGRTPEVQVDHFRAQFTGQGGIFRQAHWVGTEQLHPQRHTRRRVGTVQQFRRELVEIGRREQAVVDPDELGHAPVDTAHVGQHVPQDVVDQPLHGRQSNLHGKHSTKIVAQFTGFPAATVNPLSGRGRNLQ